MRSPGRPQEVPEVLMPRDVWCHLLLTSAISVDLGSALIQVSNEICNDTKVGFRLCPYGDGLDQVSVQGWVKDGYGCGGGGGGGW